MTDLCISFVSFLKNEEKYTKSEKFFAYFLFFFTLCCFVIPYFLYLNLDAKEKEVIPEYMVSPVEITNDIQKSEQPIDSNSKERVATSEPTQPVDSGSDVRVEDKKLSPELANFLKAYSSSDDFRAVVLQQVACEEINADILATELSAHLPKTACVISDFSLVLNTKTKNFILEKIKKLKQKNKEVKLLETTLESMLEVSVR